MQGRAMIDKLRFPVLFYEGNYADALDWRNSPTF